MKTLSKMAFIACVLFASCQKKDDPKPPTGGPDPIQANSKVFMEFTATAGSDPLVMNSKWYQNEAGDSFRVTKFNYYISNIVLNGADGTANYTEPESYHLVETPSTPGQVAFNLAEVPAGKYKSVTYMIGVDSARNTAGAQTGDLDKLKGNFWSWNSGYIMLKFEGMSPVSPNADGRMVMHCGGFSGENNVLKKVTLPFPQTLDVTADVIPHVHVEANLLQMFKSPNTIHFANITSIHMPGPTAKMLSDNYANMFKVTYAGR